MADINNIIDPKLIDSLIKINEQLIIAGQNIDKLIPSLNKLGEETSIIGKGTGDNATKQKQLTDAQKESDKIAKQLAATEAKINSLNDQSTQKLIKARTELQQNTKAVKDLQRAQLAQKGSTEQLLAVNVILEKRLKGVNQATTEGKKRADLLRSAIDKNNKKITEQSSELNKQKRGIGGYSAGIQDAVSKTGLFSRELTIISRIQATITVLTQKQTAAQNASTAATSLGTKALRILKVALISTGIGALVVALGSLVAYFKASEEGAASLQRILSPFKILFGNLKDLAIGFGKTISNAFENPKEAVASLWKSIKQNIVNRFEGLIDTFKYFGKTIESAFNLDWKGVKENAGKAGESIVQTVTGVDDAFNKAKDAVTGFIDETKKENEQNKRLANDRLALIKRERSASIELAKLEIEIQDNRLKLKDEENYTDAQRLQFAKEAQDAIEKQGQIETELAAKRLQYRKLENSFSTSSQEDLDEEAALTVALINTKSDATKKTLRIESEKQTILRKLKADEIALEKQTISTIIEARKSTQDEFSELIESEFETYQNDLDKKVEATITSGKETIKIIEDNAEKEKQIAQEKADKLADISVQLGSLLGEFASGQITSFKELSKELLLVALNALEKQILITQVEILAKDIATKGLFGVATSAIKVGLIETAFAGIKGVIQGFETGTNYAPGGVAELAERGSEMVRNPDGKIWLAENRGLYNLERGSKVFTHSETVNKLNDKNIVTELRGVKRAILKHPRQQNSSRFSDRQRGYRDGYLGIKHRLN